MTIDQGYTAKKEILTAEVRHSNCEDAVHEFKQLLGDEELACVLFFCSPTYDPGRLNQLMSEVFSCPVFGCTTAGEIGESYNKDSLVGIGLPSRHFSVQVRLIRDLDQFDIQQGNALKHTIESAFERECTPVGDNKLGFVLIDGLSGMEEMTIANLYNNFDGMEIVGGSSADNLSFEHTTVFGENQYASNAAVFAVIYSDLPFRTFKFQHFEPTDQDMVITRADIKNRIVYEIDGLPAAEEYAELLGLDIDELNSQVFAEHPVMLQIGNEWYVRSIQKVNPDGSISFYCAIDEGIPLTIAKGMDYIDTIKSQIDNLRSELGEITLTIGCDCILRRLEMERLEVFVEVEKILKTINFIGFSSYGEQYNSIHVNQTLTGVAFGSV